MTDSFYGYDVIVIGAGHAGSEAALAAARTGAHTLLLTHNIETIGAMSCNPAIGGIGKGHLVKEIDALGGAMAHAADAAGIQWRTLNASKGPAMRATRCQADRALYRAAIRQMIEGQARLNIFQAEVDDLLFEGDTVCGAITHTGLHFKAPAVVLTAGTFLAGKIHIGPTQYAAGRMGDPPATMLAARLRERLFTVARLKTGTPPRIDGRTLNYTAMQEQPGDAPRPTMSFIGNSASHPLKSAAGLLKPPNAHMRSSGPPYTARRCTAGKLRAPAHAIAHQLKTKWCASPRKIATKFSLSLKG